MAEALLRGLGDYRVQLVQQNNLVLTLSRIAKRIKTLDDDSRDKVLIVLPIG